MSNVSNYNVFDIVVDGDGNTNITPRMLYELALNHLIIKRDGVGDLNDYTYGVDYFVHADKEGNNYLMKLQGLGEIATYTSSGLDVPFSLAE